MDVPPSSDTRGKKDVALNAKTNVANTHTDLAAFRELVLFEGRHALGCEEHRYRHLYLPVPTSMAIQQGPDIISIELFNMAVQQGPYTMAMLFRTTTLASSPKLKKCVGIHSA